jgi:hypothetical protein
MNRVIVFALLGLVFHGEHLLAQRDTVAMRYASTITAAELSQHLYIIASDEYKGRDTGSPELKKAAEYLADYYKTLGVTPGVNGSSYFQPYQLKQEKFGEAFIYAGNQTFAFKKDMYSFGGFEFESLEAEKVVFAGYGISADKYDDYAGLDVNGAVVMIMMGEPVDAKGNSIFTGNNSLSEWSDDFRMKRDLAAKKGAKAVLFIDDNFDYIMKRIGYFLDEPRMSLDYPEQGSKDQVLPYYFVSTQSADAFLKANKKKPWLTYKKKIDKKKTPIHFTIKSKVKMTMKKSVEYFSADNVLAFIEGSDPAVKDEVIVISAHYDHVGEMQGKIYNGADDDGSGTVTTMEIAQAFQQAKNEGKGPRRSILILHVSGEEKGLLGSEWYSEFPIYPLSSTVCNLNIDMIGRVDDAHKDDENYVYIIGSDMLSTDLHLVSEGVNKTYTQLALDYTYNDPDDPNRFYYRSDHYNFAKHNIPVIFYFSGVHEDYHQPGDDPEKIMYDKMAKIGKLIFYTAWEVANRPQRLVVDKAK